MHVYRARTVDSVPSYQIVGQSSSHIAHHYSFEQRRTCPTYTCRWLVGAIGQLHILKQAQKFVCRNIMPAHSAQAPVRHTLKTLRSLELQS